MRYSVSAMRKFIIGAFLVLLTLPLAAQDRKTAWPLSLADGLPKGLPGYAAGRILVRLSDHARRIERGHAIPTNVAARSVMLSSVQVRTGASGCAGVRRAVAPTTG